MSRTIAVLGCGWLGFPLAQSLIQKGYRVKGTTTSEDKLAKLSEAGIAPYLISLYEDRLDGDITLFLKDVDYLIINIPPRLKKGTEGRYVSKMQLLIKEVNVSNLKKVLFISSSAVYGNTEGIINETSAPLPVTESGKQLLETEKLLREEQGFDCTILRFGGLIGNGRNPAGFLSGKTNIAQPLAPVNLVHLDDCIHIVEEVIRQETWGEVFNVAFPHHPSKKSYYQQKAYEQHMPIPEFNEKDLSTGKIISSEKLINILSYTFKTHI